MAGPGSEGRIKMNYRRTVESLMTDYARSYPTENEALMHLFFTCGNGYKWRNGQLVSETTKKERERWKEERRLTRIEALGYEPPEETVEQQRRSYYDNLSWLHSRGCTGIKKLPDGRFAVHRTFSQYDKIQSIPGNVKPDWLEAAKKAIAHAESDLVTLDEYDKELLERAKKKVRGICP